MIDTRLSPAAVPRACRDRADCTPPLCTVCDLPEGAEIDASNAAALAERERIAAEAEAQRAVSTSLFPDLDGHWYAVRDTDPRLYALYRRHYSFEKVANYPGKRSARLQGRILKMAQFGDYLALLTADSQAGWLWIRAPQGVWQNGATGVNCSFFRNESPILSSALIQEAVEAAWRRWPGERLFTHVWDDKVKSINPGYCFKRAGWSVCGRNADGRLTILEIRPPSSVALPDVSTAVDAVRRTAWPELGEGIAVEGEDR